MSFTTQRLTNSRTVVSGQDTAGNTGSTVLDTRQWDEVKAHDAGLLAQGAFDATVEEFFAPLVAAADALEAAAKVAQDPIGFIVLHEGTEGTPAQREQVIVLDQASIIMRLIENNESDRLVWVNDSLEVLESSSVSAPPPLAHDPQFTDVPLPVE